MRTNTQAKFSRGVALVLTALLTLVTVPATADATLSGGADWPSFRGNDHNMGITSAPTPRTDSEAYLKWGIKYSPNWSTAITPPIVVNGSLYIAQGKKILRLDPADGSTLAVSGELSGSVSFAMNPVTYGDGMIFVPVGSGKVHALCADTLESLWVSEPLDGQMLTPITYKNGYLYTGTWRSETRDGTFLCLSAADEAPDQTDETKPCTWKITRPGGFYWAGAYATDDYVVFGSDDGTDSANSPTAVVYSVQPETGMVIDTLQGIEGDIRSAIAYDAATDRIYFTSKAGMLYQVKVNGDGTFDRNTLQTLALGGAATGTPLVYDGLLYVGMQGKSQFSGTDHGFKIIDVTTTPMKVVGASSVPGYLQASALACTAYQDETGKVYLYTTYNQSPGGIYVLELEKSQQVDQDGAAIVTLNAGHLFTPPPEMQQYCICSLVCDNQGTLYYKNDSGYLMAIGKRAADLSVEYAGAEQQKASLRVTAAQPVQFTAMVAGYRSGRLVKLIPQQIAAAAGTTVHTVDYGELPPGMCDKITLMAWDSLDGMHPLCEPVHLP